MKHAPYFLVAIVVVLVGAWIYWHRVHSQATTSTTFRMAIDDVFALKATAKVVVVGKIAEGEVRPGDRLKIIRDNAEITVEVEALEAFGSPVLVGRNGDAIGILLIGITKEDVAIGSMLVR